MFEIADCVTFINMSLHCHIRKQSRVHPSSNRVFNCTLNVDTWAVVKWFLVSNCAMSMRRGRTKLRRDEVMSPLASHQSDG
jgi:hypothetical protein